MENRSALLGKFLEQRAPDHRHVARRGHVRGIVQAVGIDEMRFLQAELGRRRVHLVGEALDRAGDAFGDHHRDVVGRLDHQHLQRVAERDLDARAEAHFRGGHARRAHRHRQRRVERQPAVAHGAAGRHRPSSAWSPRRDTRARSHRSRSASGRCRRRRPDRASPTPRRRRAPARRASAAARSRSVGVSLQRHRSKDLRGFAGDSARRADARHPC